MTGKKQYNIYEINQEKKSKLNLIFVGDSASEHLHLAWSWIRELAKEANLLSMTTTKSKWLPISSSNRIIITEKVRGGNVFVKHYKKTTKEWLYM